MANVNSTSDRPTGEVNRDIDKWGCEDCFRVLRDGPYESCPDCGSEDVVPRRKFVVVSKKTIEVAANNLNPTLAHNHNGDGNSVVQIYDHDTGDKIWQQGEGRSIDTDTEVDDG